jgi:hypothetical protein
VTDDIPILAHTCLTGSPIERLEAAISLDVAVREKTGFNVEQLASFRDAAWRRR